MNNLFKSVLIISIVSTVLNSSAQTLDHKVVDDYIPSMITATPLEGRMLAMKIVRKTIGAIQPNPIIKLAVRHKYQDDPQLLLYSAELMAIEFKTIAVANNYWREVD